MNVLDAKTCEACKTGADAITEKEKLEYLPIIAKWEVVVEEGIEKITRLFTFKNFVEALAFTNKVGEVAESENHHPDITTRYGSVSIVIYTHKINGLHLNDFILAAKIDSLN